VKTIKLLIFFTASLLLIFHIKYLVSDPFITWQYFNK